MLQSAPNFCGRECRCPQCGAPVDQEILGDGRPRQNIAHCRGLPSSASRGRHVTGIQRISDFLRDVAPSRSEMLFTDGTIFRFRGVNERAPLVASRYPRFQCGGLDRR
jgi:hypothetical protein